MCKGVMKQYPVVSQDYSVPEMTSSFGDDLEKELNGLLESREYSLSCRLKIYFLGDKNAGKTSLVKSLIGENACLADAPSEGTLNYIWRPFKDNNSLLQRRPSLDERNLTLDLWDMTGRKVCQGIHQMFLSRALYVLVFNLVDSDSCQQLPKYISYVQAKIPGCPLLVVATRADKLFTANERTQKAEETLAGVRAAQQAEVDAIKHDITQISDLGADPKLLAQIEWLEGLLQNRPKLRPPIQVVSCKTGKGLSELRRKLVNMALDCELFPHTGQLLKPEQIRLCELIDQTRAAGKLLITWAEYRDLAKEAAMTETSIVIQEEKQDMMTDDELHSNLILLEHLGTVSKLHGLTSASEKHGTPYYICIRPQKLGEILCCCHVDNPRKIFRIEGRRFWPEGETPDPATLVKFLEEIPHQGYIREVLLPLLWQDCTLDEDQVQRILDLLTTSGLLTPQIVTLGEASEPSTENQSKLSLPQYTNLSQSRKYHANLIGLIPDKRPLLNWSPKPFKGDVQVTWRYSFPCGSPPGLTQRMLGACRAAAVNDFYKHQWRYGLLVKLDDAVVCVEVDTVDLYVDVSCRVNADDPREEDEAVQFLWAHLAPFVRATRALLTHWPGLVYKLELIPFGPLFHGGETMGGEHAFPVCQCFMSARTDTPITFTEGGVERALHGDVLLQMDGKEHPTLDAWLADIVSRRQAVIEQRSVTPLSPPPKAAHRKDTDGAPPTQKTKKKLEIKWDLAEDDTMKNKPVTSADTGNNNKSPDKKNSRDETTSAKDSTKSSKNHNDTDGEAPAGAMVLTEEQQTQEAMRVASGFVASLLAQAVADYVQAVHEDNHTGMGKQVVTKAQVEAARRTALAAVAAQTGEIDTTAKAVMDAAKSLQQFSFTDNNMAKSKTCVIL